MANVKPYAFNYTNADLPFNLKVKYKEGIEVFPREHEACVQVTPGQNAPTLPLMKVRVIPDNGKNGPEFLMNIVAS